MPTINPDLENELAKIEGGDDRATAMAVRLQAMAASGYAGTLSDLLTEAAALFLELSKK